MKDGNEVIFEKTKSQNDLGFKTFAERYADYKNGKENKQNKNMENRKL